MPTDWSALARLLASGNPGDALQEVSRRRFGMSSPDPAVAAIPEDALSKADRFTHGAVIEQVAHDLAGDPGSLAILPFVAAGFTGYEALKKLGGPALLNALSVLHPELAAGSNTSPASMENVQAPLRGFWEQWKQRRAKAPPKFGMSGAGFDLPELAPELAAGGLVLPPGFVADESAAPPAGFVLDKPEPAPPPGFTLDTPGAGDPGPASSLNLSAIGRSLSTFSGLSRPPLLPASTSSIETHTGRSASGAPSQALSITPPPPAPGPFDLNPVSLPFELIGVATDRTVQALSGDPEFGRRELVKYGWPRRMRTQQARSREEARVRGLLRKGSPEERERLRQIEQGPLGVLQGAGEALGDQAAELLSNPANFVVPGGGKALQAAFGLSMLPGVKPAAEELGKALSASEGKLDQRSTKALVDLLATSGMAGGALSGAAVGAGRVGQRKLADWVRRRGIAQDISQGLYSDPAARSSEAGFLSPRGPAQVRPLMTEFAPLDQARAIAAQGPSLWSRIKETFAPENLQTQLYDRTAPVKRAARAAARSLGETSTFFDAQTTPLQNDPRMVLPLTQNTAARVEWLTHQVSQIETSARKVGLSSSLQDYLDLKGWERELAWAQNHRIPRLRADNKLAEAARLQARIDKGRLVPLGHTPQSIARDLTKLQAGLTPEQLTGIQTHAQQLWDLNRQLLDLQHASGIISDKEHAAITSKGQEYVPLNRIFSISERLRTRGDWGYASGLSLAQIASLHKFQGSSRATIRPFEASTIAGARVFSDLARNEAAHSIIGLHEQAPGVLPGFRKLKSTDIVPKDAPIISRYVNGAQERWLVPKEFAAVMALRHDPLSASVLGRTIRAARDTLRFGAVTGNIAFSVANVPRDLWRLSVDSRAIDPSLPRWVGRRVPYVAWEWAKAVKSVLSQDADYTSALWNRALGSSLSRQLIPERYALPGRELSRADRAGKYTLEILSLPSRIFEDSTKLAGYNMLRKSVDPVTGNPRWDPRQAAYETIEYVGTPNAAQHGEAITEFNALVPFLNVAIQGSTSMWRRRLQEPGRTVVAPLITATALSLALVKYNSQFDDGENGLEWDRIPDDMKANYWLVINPLMPRNPETGRMAVLKIAKEQGAKSIYNPIEAVTWQALTSSAPNWYQTGVTTAAESLPIPNLQFRPGQEASSLGRSALGMLNPFIREPAEQALLLDAYRGTPIERTAEQGLAPTERYDERTSPTAVVGSAQLARGARFFDQLLPGERQERLSLAVPSPRRIEHLVRGITAGLGEEGLSITDPLLQKFSPQPRPARPGVERVPVLSSIVRRGMSLGTRDKLREDLTERFYAKKAILDQLADTHKRLERANPTRAAGFAQEEHFTPGQVLAQRRQLDGVAKRLSALYAELRAAPTPADALKVNKQILSLLREVNKTITF